MLNKLRLTITLLCVVVLLSLMLLHVPRVQALTWTIQTVDSSTADVGWYSSIDLDSSGKPHISYTNHTLVGIPATPAFTLKYAKWTGSTWALETVDSDDIGVATSLALDSNDNPHISYDTWYTEDLRYAKKIGSSWYIDTFVDSGGLWSSIALDSNNYPHISHASPYSDDIKYAQWTGSEWFLETAAISGSSGFHCTSLALDSNDKPHMSFTHWLWGGTLYYANKTGDSWYLKAWTGLGGTWKDLWADIAVDSTDCPHICYYDYWDGYLKYMKWTGTEWSIDDIDYLGTDLLNIGYCSIALDYKDRAHISYYDEVSEDLKYAWWTGVDWSIETVDPSGDVGQFCSIAVNSADGTVHISYYDETNGNLKYATTKVFRPPGPYPLPGATSSTPALACDGYETHMVVRGTDNGIYYMRTDYMGGGGWSGVWTNIPDATCDEPALAVMGSNLHLVVRGTDNGIYHKIMDINTGAWGSWTQLPGSTVSAPTLVTSTTDSLALVVRGSDNGIYLNRWRLVEIWPNVWFWMWTGWTTIPGATIDKPALASDFTTLTLAVRGSDNGIYVKMMDLSSGVWGGWSGMGATLSAPTVEASFYEDDFVLVVRGTDNKIYYTYTWHGEWSGPWFNVPGATIDRPLLAKTSYYDEIFHFVVRGSDNGIYHSMFDGDFGGWTGWTTIPGKTTSCPGLTEYYYVGLELVYHDPSNNIWYDDWSSGTGW